MKKRAVVSPAAGAVSLPSLMAELPGTRRLEEVPLDKLSLPAPAAWNFLLPLPDDKLLELIESIRTSELLHPIVVWKQPDGDLMILSGLQPGAGLHRPAGKRPARISTTASRPPC